MEDAWLQSIRAGFGDAENAGLDREANAGIKTRGWRAANDAGNSDAAYALLPRMTAEAANSLMKKFSGYVSEPENCALTEWLVENPEDAESVLFANPGYTSSHLVSWKAEVINRLEPALSKRVLDLQDADGDTALIEVANIAFDNEEGHERMKALLGAGADPAIKNNEGKTAYEVAMENIAEEKEASYDDRYDAYLTDMARGIKKVFGKDRDPLLEQPAARPGNIDLGDVLAVLQ